MAWPPSTPLPRNRAISIWSLMAKFPIVHIFFFKNGKKILIFFSARGIATFHTSQQGGVKLEFGGHLYIKNRQRGSVIHWRCDRNKSDRCLGTARTDGMEEGVSVVELGKAHNHAPSPDRCAVARLKARVRAAALDARENAPQTVVDEVGFSDFS